MTSSIKIIATIAMVEETAQLIADKAKYVRYDDTGEWDELANQAAKLKRLVWEIRDAWRS